MKKTLFRTVLFLFSALASAGADTLSATAVAEDTLDVNLDSIKAEMSACFVCSTVAEQWYKLCPKVKFKVEKTYDQVEIVQNLGNSKEAKKYQEKCPARDKAFSASLYLKPDEAKAKLCRLCQQLYRLVEVGAGVRRNQEKGYERLIISTFGNAALSARCDTMAATFPGRFGLIEQRGPQWEKEVIFDSTESVASTDSMTKTEPFDSIGVDEEPELIKSVPPHFPAESIRSRKQGKVIVALLVTANGRVARARIIKSSDEMFNDAALEAVRNWVFKPAVIKGKKVKFWYHAPIIFQFDN